MRDAARRGFVRGLIAMAALAAFWQDLIGKNRYIRWTSEHWIGEGAVRPFLVVGWAVLLVVVCWRQARDEHQS